MKHTIDLHMHSELSHDGSATLDEYIDALDNNILDVVAITDHNQIEFAQALKAKFGSRVIVGEEVSTDAGDVIGLFLTDLVVGKRPLLDVISDIKAQGGLVYIPHPFDIRRHGLGEENLLKILPKIDIIETFNARNITPGGNKRAQKFAHEHNLTAAYGSDAHWISELGRTYNVVAQGVTRDNLCQLLKAGKHIGQRVGWRKFFSPGINKLRKKLAK